MGAQRRPCKAERTEEEDRQREGRKNARGGDRFVACGMLSRPPRSSAMPIAIVLIATPTSNFFYSCSSSAVAFDSFTLPPPTTHWPHISAFHAAGTTVGFAPLPVAVVGGSGLWVLGSGRKGRGGREGGGEREEGEGPAGGGGGIAFRVFQRGSKD